FFIFQNQVVGIYVVRLTGVFTTLFHIGVFQLFGLFIDREITTVGICHSNTFQVTDIGCLHQIHHFVQVQLILLFKHASVFAFFVFSTVIAVFHHLIDEEQ